MSFVVLKKKPSGSQKKPLFIVVKKTEYKKATERNLIKRRVRAITKPFLGKERKYDYCVIVKSGANVVSFQELKKEILRQLNAVN